MVGGVFSSRTVSSGCYHDNRHVFLLLSDTSQTNCAPGAPRGLRCGTFRPLDWAAQPTLKHSLPCSSPDLCQTTAFPASDAKNLTSISSIKVLDSRAGHLFRFFFTIPCRSAAAAAARAQPDLIFFMTTRQGLMSFSCARWFHKRSRTARTLVQLLAHTCMIDILLITRGHGYRIGGLYLQEIGHVLFMLDLLFCLLFIPLIHFSRFLRYQVTISCSRLIP
jgi:hypothetical protein